jgi:hypothetical protein
LSLLNYTIKFTLCSKLHYQIPGMICPVVA